MINNIFYKHNNPFEMRIKHISHLDLDGYSSTILTKVIQNVLTTDNFHCYLECVNIAPHRLLNELRDTVEHLYDYDVVIITDLAVNEEIVKLIQEYERFEKIYVFDHHITNIENLPQNFTIRSHDLIDTTKLTCATSLYHNYIMSDLRVGTLIRAKKLDKALYHFAECVRCYDTFEFWNKRYENIDKNNFKELYNFEAPRLNTLFHILDHEEFEKYILDYINNIKIKYFNNKPSLTAFDMNDYIDDNITHYNNYSYIEKLIDYEMRKNDKYIEAALGRLTKTPFKCKTYYNGKLYTFNYLIGIVFSERSSPMIANTALERNTDLDICAVATFNQISIYTNKENIDVSMLAKILGGGGHKKAAGFTIPYNNAVIYNLEHFSSIINCAAKYIPSDKLNE